MADPLPSISSSLAPPQAVASRDLVEWALALALTPQALIIVLGLLLGLSLSINLVLARRTRHELVARIAAYGEAYEWLKYHALLTHNLIWRLFSELRHQINVRPTDGGVAQRKVRMRDLEGEIIRVLYAKPVLPIVKKRHLKIQEQGLEHGAESEPEAPE